MGPRDVAGPRDRFAGGLLGIVVYLTVAASLEILFSGRLQMDLWDPVGLLICGGIGAWVGPGVMRDMGR